MVEEAVRFLVKPGNFLEEVPSFVKEVSGFLRQPARLLVNPGRFVGKVRPFGVPVACHRFKARHFGLPPQQLDPVGDHMTVRPFIGKGDTDRLSFRKRKNAKRAAPARLFLIDLQRSHFTVV